MSQKLVDLPKFSMTFVTLGNTSKNGPNLLSSWERLFCEMFVSIELLGPGEMILIFAQYLSKCLMDTYKLFHDTFHVQ